MRYGGIVRKPEMKALICPLRTVKGKTDAIGNRITLCLKYRSPMLYFLKGINEIRDGRPTK